LGQLKRALFLPAVVYWVGAKCESIDLNLGKRGVHKSSEIFSSADLNIYLLAVIPLWSRENHENSFYTKLINTLKSSLIGWEVAPPKRGILINDFDSAASICEMGLLMLITTTPRQAIIRVRKLVDDTSGQFVSFKWSVHHW